MLIVFVQCSKDNKHSMEDEEIVKVSFSVGGEFSINESPLTKSSDDLVFGLSIFQDGVPFANGVFDRIDNINAFLKANHKYTFKCSLIKNGKQCLYYYNYGNYFHNPFQLVCSGASTTLSLENKLNYKPGEYYLNLSAPSDYNSDNTYKYKADRYYCEVYNYSPEENGSVILNLKHTVIGLKYTVDGLSDGTLDILASLNGHWVFYETVSSNAESDELLLECNDVLSAYNYPDTYTETASFRLKWHRGNNIDQDLGSVNVDLKRNMMNTVRIHLSSSNGNAQFGITQEVGDMTTDSVDVEVK